jgi:hypothetical protein
MKSIFSKRKTFQIMIIFLAVILFICLVKDASSFYAPLFPTWRSNVNIGQNNLLGGFNYSGYEVLSNPYLIGPAMGVYFPYNTRFDIYSGGYAYNANALGFYNRGFGQQDVDAFGYPLPYASVNQTAWGNQAGYLGFPPIGNMGNIMNIAYNPGAFTIDLGLDAYYTGIANFWKKALQGDEEEEEE